MLELILTAINAKLAMLNKLANLYCLAERRPIEGGKTVPYAYRGGRDLQPINIDSGSVGYWRINGEGSDEYINDPYVAGQQRQVTWPLRFYAMAHRDSQFTASALADLIGSTITDADDDVAQLLDMEDVSITVSGRDLDTTALYGSEFDELDLSYHLAFIALTVTVTIRGSANCFPDPCDIDTDILHSFNFCDAATRARLTDEQVSCLEAALCETPPTLCEQLAEVLPADVVADVFDCLTPEAQAELLDSECVIPPCADATARLFNTVPTLISTTPIASGASANITAPNAVAVLKDTAGATLSTTAIPSNVSADITAPDGTVLLDGAAYSSVVSGGTIDVNSQSYARLGTKTWLWCYADRALISGYAGNLLRFRKTTGGAEFDTPQNANGYADVAFVTANRGADSATMRTIYDQVGTGVDLIQATVGNQPRYAVPSATDFGHTNVWFGQTPFMTCAKSLALNSTLTVYMVVMPQGAAGAMIASSGSSWWLEYSGSNTFYMYDGTIYSASANALQPFAFQLVTVQLKQNALVVRVNKVQVLSSATWSRAATTSFNIGSRVGGSNLATQGIRACVAHSGDLDTAIEDQLIAAYGL